MSAANGSSISEDTSTFALLDAYAGVESDDVGFTWCDGGIVDSDDGNAVFLLRNGDVESSSRPLVPVDFRVHGALDDTTKLSPL